MSPSKTTTKPTRARTRGSHVFRGHRRRPAARFDGRRSISARMSSKREKFDRDLLQPRIVGRNDGIAARIVEDDERVLDVHDRVRHAFELQLPVERRVRPKPELSVLTAVPRV